MCYVNQVSFVCITSERGHRYSGGTLLYSSWPVGKITHPTGERVAEIHGPSR